MRRGPKEPRDLFTSSFNQFSPSKRDFFHNRHHKAQDIKTSKSEFKKTVLMKSRPSQAFLPNFCLERGRHKNSEELQS